MSRGWWGVQPPPPGWWDGGWYYEKRTITTGNTQPVQPAVPEKRIREIVREEVADIVPVDVPDEPPEDWS